MLNANRGSYRQLIYQGLVAETWTYVQRNNATYNRSANRLSARLTVRLASCSTLERFLRRFGVAIGRRLFRLCGPIVPKSADCRIKIYADAPCEEARRYSLSDCVGTRQQVVVGDPCERLISASTAWNSCLTWRQNTSPAPATRFLQATLKGVNFKRIHYLTEST